MNHKHYHKKIFQLINILLVTIFFISCSEKDEQTDLYDLKIPAGLDSLAMFIPDDNPLTLEKIKLGRKLFFDERLSIDGTLSCASCHNPLLGFADGRSVAVGIEGLEGTRSTPSIINRLFSETQFWDGRANSLEEQILGPIQNPIEMNNTLENVVNTLNNDEAVKKEFQKVFGTDVTVASLQKAIASFERILLSGESPFDKYIAGDKNAVSESARKGLVLFKSQKTNCIACHKGPNFTDELFHNSGVGMDLEKPDLGRFIETKNDTDLGKFKTPTLRDIARTSPYMHNGTLRSLREVIDFYDKGGIVNDNLSIHIKPLNLTEEEKGNLIDFLRSLTGENPLAAGKNQSLGIN
jgi:cytochrome c peroxidase